MRFPIILLLEKSFGFEAECVQHCDGLLEKCLVDCGGNSDCARLCVRDSDRCNVKCKVKTGKTSFP